MKISKFAKKFFLSIKIIPKYERYCEPLHIDDSSNKLWFEVSNCLD